MELKHTENKNNFLGKPVDLVFNYLTSELENRKLSWDMLQIR